MKRSNRIRLVLLGGLSAGALVATAAAAETRISPGSVYLNDYFVPGAGYYHAPFQAFFAHPYNHYDAQRKEYFYGGQWGPVPHRSIVNISAPTVQAAAAADAALAARAAERAANNARNVQRSGFGSTSRHHGVYS